MTIDQTLIATISQLAAQIEGQVVAYRQDLHHYAETGWTEFRTASLVARRLSDLGFEVLAGRQVISGEDRMGLPCDEELERCWNRAVAQGGDRAFLDAVRGGFTGVVGVLRCGLGPTIGLRFDMDALALDESRDPEHRPAALGFASMNPGASHACGHDAHTAVGLGIAEILVGLRAKLSGTVKLIFQPAEDGVRGAKSMVAAGIVDDLDFLIGHHVYSGWETGQIACGMGGYLATTKFDAIFTGAPAHAAASPHRGRNALLAAATAVLNLYAIPRHRDGITRINVGRLDAGTGRNVICPRAFMAIETRGSTTELNDYMFEYATRILRSAADMHECQIEIANMGSAQSASSDPELQQRVASVADAIGSFAIRHQETGGGSEDLTYMMQRVQERGGLATNIGIGADLGQYGHHTDRFDLDENALKGAVILLSCLVLDLARPDLTPA